MAEREQQYWLHRITGGENGWKLSYPLLRECQILSIGWSFISNQETAAAILQNGLSAIVNAYKERKVTWSRSAYSLLKFVHSMHEGDVVIVPDGPYINVYRLADDTIYTNDNIDIPRNILDSAGVWREDSYLGTAEGDEIDLGFYRKVEPLALKVLRSELDEGIYRKTRTQQTTLNISDVGDEIESLIKKFTGDKLDTKQKPIEYSKLIEDIEKELFISDEEDNKESAIVQRLENVFVVLRELINNGVEFFVKPKIGSKDSKNIVISFDSVQEKVEYNINTIIDVVKSYMRGDIHQCINDFKEWCKDSADFTTTQIRHNDVYFRIRLKDNSRKTFDRKDLFHVPFDKRGTVSTKRYSIPGYPCLYLGRSIYVCWEELKRPALSDFATSAFKAMENILLLDLRLKKEMQSSDECEKYLMMLPVIIACSLFVTNEDDNFKPEYIIPQLLLHVIVKNNQNEQVEMQNDEGNRVSGIIYTSTAISNDLGFVNVNNPSTFYLADCAVLPTVIPDDIRGIKFCSFLTQEFSVTKPKYYENEFIKDSLAFMRYHMEKSSKCNGLNEVNKVHSSYDSSYFSFMEKCWQESEFAELDIKGKAKNE